DCLQRSERSPAVVFLFRVGQFAVRHQAWMLFRLVVALAAPGPTIGQSLRGPNIVGILGQLFRQRLQRSRELHVNGINWFRHIFHGNSMRGNIESGKCICTCKASMESPGTDPPGFFSLALVPRSYYSYGMLTHGSIQFAKGPS